MKIGDTLAVQIDGTDVAEAYVEDMDEDTATIVIPATRLVVRVNKELDVAHTPAPEVDRLLVGTETPATSPVEPTESLADMDLDSSAID